MNIFYFDFTSPYSYLTWERMIQLGFNLESLDIRPVVVGKIISDVGSIGPAGIKPKRNFLFQDCLRKAERFGLILKSPARLPFNPMDMLRFAISLQADTGLKIQFITQAFRYGWQKGGDYEDFLDFKKFILETTSLSEQMYEACANDKEARKILKENNSLAIAQQVFGVPSFVADGKVFWGFDSLDDFLKETKGFDSFDFNNEEYLRFLNIVDNNKGEGE